MSILVEQPKVDVIDRNNTYQMSIVDEDTMEYNVVLEELQHYAR